MLKSAPPSTPFSRLAEIARLRAGDWLRFHPAFGEAAGVWLAAQAGRRAGAERLATLARAARACSPGPLRRRLEGRLIRELERVDERALDWEALDRSESDPRRLKKAIILKPPLPGGERGVIYTTFENQWIKLLAGGQAPEIGREYDLVLGPTWSPPHDASLLLAARFWPNPVFTLLSNLEDGPTMRAFSDRLVPVPLLASSWTNPVYYEPYLTREKTIDIVMIATFSPYKRHWHFFQVLSQLPESVRAVLIGRRVGNRTVDWIRAQARLFGVLDRVEVRSGVSDAEIAECLCRARISLIFSRQEGSCIAVAESMMAGTPVGLFRDARIGSRAFINPRTGVLLERREVARQIARFLEIHDRFRPRQWAIGHISHDASTRALNEYLRAESLRTGRPWTRDIVPMYQNSVPLFANPEDADAMRPCYDGFLARYGIEIVRPSPAAVAGDLAAVSGPAA